MTVEIADRKSAVPEEGFKIPSWDCEIVAAINTAHDVLEHAYDYLDPIYDEAARNLILNERVALSGMAVYLCILFGTGGSQ